MNAPTNASRSKALCLTLACAALLVAAAPAYAELADVYLKSGLRLRGDVTRTTDEVIVRNAAGEVHLAYADVVRIVPVEPPKPPSGVDHAAVADTDSKRAPPATRPAEPKPEALPPAPWLSKRDINRLKLAELTLDGPAENVKVRFRRKAGQKQLPDQVLEELRKRGDFQSSWVTVLTRGRPEEKLQLILCETGLEHADRIELLSDPAAFTMYRRRVLPLVNRGCARSGCHAGTSARLFRFPVGSSTGDAYTYTSFVLLDQMMTRHGPLLDRASPESSLLLSYLLPQEDNPRAHPPVGRGPSFKPVIRKGKRDPQYRDVVDWINFLLVPHPNYGLEYDNPYTGPFTLKSAEQDKPVAPPDEPEATPPQPHPQAKEPPKTELPATP